MQQKRRRKFKPIYKDQGGQKLDFQMEISSLEIFLSEEEREKLNTLRVFKREEKNEKV